MESERNYALEESMKHNSIQRIQAHRMIDTTIRNNSCQKWCSQNVSVIPLLHLGGLRLSP